jgi:SOS response regulatory protein OraA/RecX
MSQLSGKVHIKKQKTARYLISKGYMWDDFQDLLTVMS